MGLSGEIVKEFIRKKRESYFEVYKDKAGEFRFRLKAPNGQIIAIGEGYTDKINCINAIKLIKSYSKGARIKDLSYQEFDTLINFIKEKEDETNRKD